MNSRLKLLSPLLNSFCSNRICLDENTRLGLRILVVSIFLPYFADSFCLGAQYTVVPLNHQVYPLLFKGEALRLFSSYHLRVLPMDRITVRTLLEEMKKVEGRLTSADRALLHQMIGEFADPPVGAVTPNESEIHAYHYEEGDAQLFLDMRVNQTFRHNHNRLTTDDGSTSETTAAGNIRGRFGEHFSIGLDASQTMIFGSDEQKDNFDPANGRIQSVTGGAVNSDQATGYVSVQSGCFSLLAGRSYISWGSGLAEWLGLSAKNEPMDMIRFMANFRHFRFSSFHANLLGSGSQRFLAGHRLDFLISRDMQFGIYETVVYANRGIEFAYFNPLLPYHIMEHQLGDRDNNMAGIDISAFLHAGLRVYAELFIDDFSHDRSIITHWGNKLAYLVGLQWAQPLDLRALELLASYTRVDPFVYTHSDSLNTYSHYGKSIGSRLGPNADRVQVGLAMQPLRDIRHEITYNFTRQGNGDIRTPHRKEDGASKGFLRGTIETNQEIVTRFKYQFKRDIFCGFEFVHKNRHNADRNPGVYQAEWYGQLFLDINY